MKKFAVMSVLHKMSTFKSYYMVLVMALGWRHFSQPKKKKKKVEKLCDCDATVNYNY